VTFLLPRCRAHCRCIQVWHVTVGPVNGTLPSPHRRTSWTCEEKSGSQGKATTSMGLTRITDTQMLSFFLGSLSSRVGGDVEAQQAVHRLSDRFAWQILVSTKRGIDSLPHRNYQSLLTGIDDFCCCDGQGKRKGQNTCATRHWRKTILPRQNAATVWNNMGVSDTIYLIFKS
jgi:hypothetical protein